MGKRIAAALLLLSGSAALAGDAGPVRPFEASSWPVPETRVDAILAAARRRAGVEGARPCSDEVFLRRAYLDVIGVLPTAAEARAFLEDRRPGRRGALLDALMEREEFADLWALRWCDALRVKAEFPINLWPDAVQAYHRWIRDAIRDEMPYDRFARELLTSSGSCFRDPQVNFQRAVQGRSPEALAAAAALTFMGTRWESLPADRRAGMTALFSRVIRKPTREWKEEIVLDDPAPRGPLEAVLPDGTAVVVPADADPRRAFADWLVSPRNPWFARAAVNRLWAWLFGRGVVEPADDLRPDNPASVPGLLEHLEEELVRSGWDLRRVMRLVLESRAWQQSPIPRAPPAEAERLFACYPVRRLDAEVLVDALCAIGGTGEGYTSIIPEPWTFVPGDRSTVSLADGSITSAFLDLFGRPPRDTGLLSERSSDVSDAQRLHLLNSSDVQRRLRGSRRLVQALYDARGNRPEIVRGIWLAVLSRNPTEEEAAAALAYAREKGRPPAEAAVDLAWALVNTAEFLHRH